MFIFPFFLLFYHYYLMTIVITITRIKKILMFYPKIDYLIERKRKKGKLQRKDRGRRNKRRTRERTKEKKVSQK